MDSEIVNFKNAIGWHKFLNLIEVLGCLSLIDDSWSNIDDGFIICSGPHCWRAVSYKCTKHFKCKYCRGKQL